MARGSNVHLPQQCWSPWPEMESATLQLAGQRSANKATEASKGEPKKPYL